MKAIRSIYYNHKHFLNLNLTRTPVSLSFFSRHFHSSSSRFALDSPEPDGNHNTPRVWTAYEPLTGELYTHSSRQTSINQDAESDSGDEATADSETERTYGKAINADSSTGDRTHKAFSDSNPRYSPEGNTIEMSEKKGFNKLEFGDIVGNRKKAKGKVKVQWVCEQCGHSDGQWWGVCRSCSSSGTMKRFSEGESKNTGLEFSETVSRTWLPKDVGNVEPVRLVDVNSGVKMMNYRIPL